MRPEKPDNVFPMFGGEFTPKERDPSERFLSLAVQAVNNEADARRLLEICEGLNREAAEVIVGTAVRLLDTGESFENVQNILTLLANRYRKHTRH